MKLYSIYENNIKLYAEMPYHIAKDMCNHLGYLKGWEIIEDE